MMASLPFGIDSQMRRQEFERIYEKHFDAVFRYIGSSVARHDVAEDIASDVFYRLLRCEQEIDENRSLAWLFTVARNLIIDHWRSVSRETPLRDQPAPHGHFLDLDWGSLLTSNPDLKPVHRVCLTLRYVHGMDRDEIAQHTGLTDNQVKSCLQYGLQLLRKVLVKG
jgi:RNA polymerase sigma-70 factor (ECF subfamily)